MHLIRSLLLCCFLLFPLSSQAVEVKKIYISPGYWGQLFGKDASKPMSDLRVAATKAGFWIEQADELNGLDNFEYLIVFEVFPEQIEKLKQYPKEKLILFLWEPPSVLPNNYDKNYHHMFSRVYTWRDDLVDNVKYFKLQYPVLQPMIAHAIPFGNKQMFTLIARNKKSKHPNELYSERKELIDFFESKKTSNFDLYGQGWPNTYKTYRGPIENKVDVLKNYRFCFAYENIEGAPGYITEKIFDCFQAGCVPVYWGAPNINHYIPKDCYIAREDFTSNEELYDYLRNMKDEEYNRYIANIKNYLESSQAYPFSGQAFVDTMMDLILNAR